MASALPLVAEWHLTHGEQPVGTQAGGSARKMVSAGIDSPPSVWWAVLWSRVARAIALHAEGDVLVVARRSSQAD